MRRIESSQAASWLTKTHDTDQKALMTAPSSDGISSGESLQAPTRYQLSELPSYDDPSSPGALLKLIPHCVGQGGAPFLRYFSQPAHHVRTPQRHRRDVVYLYCSGFITVEGEGCYSAGQVRWVRAGTVVGEERTGADGCTFWKLASDDPLTEAAETLWLAQQKQAQSAPGLASFAAPFDWPAIDEAVRTHGAAVAKGLVAPELIELANRDFETWHQANPGSGVPSSGSVEHDAFLGRKTLRIHGLCSKLSCGADLVGHPEIVAWAERMLLPHSATILLNSAELIQIAPGEPSQPAHRDTEAWHRLERRLHPLMVNAMVVLHRFTKENGSTHIAPDSHLWAVDRMPTAQETLQQDLEPGDTLLFRGDVIHHGGANRSSELRRGLSLSYCVGWIRPYENSYLNIPKALVRKLPPKVQDILGYAMEDALLDGGRRLGLYENDDPHKALLP